MRSSWITWLAACTVLFACGVSHGQDTFTLGFQGPATLSGAPGSTVTAMYTCTMTHSGNLPEGAQGWSISFAAERATIVVDSITVDGTDAANPDFNQTETTDPAISEGDCAGKSGATSAVVLAFMGGRILPVNATSSTAVFELSATIPQDPGTALLSYVNGCRKSGQAVENVVTQAGQSPMLVLGTFEIALEPVVAPVDCCTAEENFGFSPARLQSATPFEGIVGVGAECLANEGEIRARAAVGEVGTTEVYANIITGGGPGPQGWSLSIEITGTPDITEATVSGTSAANVADGGKEDGGFASVEIVDPSDPLNAGRRGVVVGMVLSFQGAVTFDSPGTESSLRMTVSSVSPLPDQGEIRGTLMHRDGLKGAGQPVENIITVGGSTGSICNVESVSADVVFEPVVGPAPKRFIRGDANDDAKVNIADPIWTLNFLFPATRGGPMSNCPSSADSNDDGRIDTADAVYTIQWRFLGGNQPNPPFPECGLDPTDDELECAENSHVSCR